MPELLRLCPLCSSDRLTPELHVDPANFIASIERFDIVRCDKCGLRAMSPMPTLDEASTIYTSENVFSQPRSYPNRGRVLSRILEPLWMRFGRDLRFIAKLCLRFSSQDRRSATAVLDIGCSTGALLTAFREVSPNLELHGLDIDPNSVTSAFPGLDKHITIGSIWTTSFSRQFEIVTMRAVIEHIIDVVPYMHRVTELVADGGILFLMTPDISSARAREKRAAWQYVNDPNQKLGHVLWFDHRSLHSLAQELGLELVYIGNRGEVFEHFPGWLRQLLVRIFGREPKSGRFIRSYVLRLCYALIVDALMSERFGCGECLYAVLRKPQRG